MKTTVLIAASAAGAVFATGFAGSVNAQSPGFVDISAAIRMSGNAYDLNATPTSAPVEPVARPGEGISKGDTVYVDVKAATLWKSPDSPRDIDAPALGNPADMVAWDKNLNTVDKRRDLTGRTETQAIYGDAVYVWEIKGSWARVGVTTEPNEDQPHGYEAWVPLIQLVKSPGFAKASEELTHVVSVTAKRATIEVVGDGMAGQRGGTQEVPFNTRLSIEKVTDSRALVVLPDNRRGWIALSDVERLDQHESRPAPTPSQLVDTAKQFLGLKYVWGGTSAYGFDCSGFTYSIYRAHGITIPRDSGPQSRAGTPVKHADLQVGDLIFFASNGGTGSVYHVGMYIGHGQMIHSPNASRSVEIVDWQSWGGAKDFSGIRRYV